MLKKLRIKFILFTMIIVTIMLSLIFGVLYISTSRNQEEESLRMMNSVAMNPMGLRPPSEGLRDVRLPYFSILIDRQGNTIETGGGFFDLSDRALVEDILRETMAADKEHGLLASYDLRFLRVETPMGKCYVYADTTNEQAVLRSLIRSFALIGAAAFLVFLGISTLLAGWAVRPVEKAWLQQKQFVADASHELKTPLTVIMTDAELIHTPECTDDEREQLSGNILTMSVQMRGLVESLLELARIDSGSVKGSMQSLVFSDLAEEASMLFEPVFFEKGMAFDYQIEPGISLKGNLAQLKQVVNIYLDNAAKYASLGGAVTLSLSKPSGKKCVLKVSNQGEPIAEEDLKNLFKRFYRVDKARTSRHSYGLGLSIAESIAQEHHGRVWAESRDGLNSFYLELPCI